MLPIFINIILAINVLVCILLIFLTLMQRPKNEGLGAAFGGGMTENLFGAETTNVLAKATRVLGATFFILTLVLSFLYSHKAMTPSSVQAELAKKQALAPSATPAESADVEKSVQAAIAKQIEKDKTAATPAASATPATPVATPAPAATPAAK